MSTARTAERQERQDLGLYRWGRIVAARVMRDELGQTNPVDIEDAESVSHLAVRYALGRYDVRRGEASTLIAMTVRQRVIQWWQRDYRHRRGIVPFASDETEWLREPAEAAFNLDRFVTSDYIRGCLRRMPTKERRLLVKVYVEERSRAEVAAMEGWSLDWLDEQLRRARRRFACLVQE